MLDIEVLDELSNLSADPQFLHTLIRGFIHDAETGIAKLKEHTGSGEEIQDLLHALKGSSMQVGATELVALLTEIQQAVAQDGRGHLPRFITPLHERFSATANALLDYVQTSPAT